MFVNRKDMIDSISKDEIVLVLGKYVELRQSAFEFSFIVTWHHIICGIRSNIPFCCIVFFIIFWKLIFLFINFSIVRKFVSWYPPRKTCNYHYVACPICVLFGRFHSLYICDENDSYCCLRKE